VTNETTCGALARLATLGEGHLACLNFASARQPGGGFLAGAQAQEESLARASALYRCLLAQHEYYERQRAELVLEVAVRHEVKQLVLGAWGCGVFRNDPRQVAGVFGELLAHGGRFAGAFSEVLFAVPDHSDDGWVHRAFADCLL